MAERIPQLSVVKLNQDVLSEGVHLARGQQGTVVFCYEKQAELLETVIVEFTRSAVVDIEESMLEVVVSGG